MILETKHVWLRRRKEDDVTTRCALWRECETMQVYTLEIIRNASVCENQESFLVVINKDDGRMIGECCIIKQRRDGKTVWEIHNRLKKPYVGYAQEIISAIGEYDNKDVDASKPTSIHVYLDGEFDAVRMNHRYQQMVISLGAVLCDESGKELTTFYETVYPLGFSKLTRVVARMTHLDDTIIKSSLRLNDVIQSFEMWIRGYDPDLSHTRIYSFGPDDRRTIVKHCELEQVDHHGLLDHVIDLQKEISHDIVYHGRILSKTLSLEDMKQVFSIKGAVEHNALRDAKDLMKVHWAYLHHQPQNEQSMQTIIKRKEQKEMEARIKQQKHFRRIMQERFAHMDTCVDIVFQPDVLEQLRNWEMRDPHVQLHFKKNHMVFEGQSYPYDAFTLTLCVDTQDEFPSVTLMMQAGNFQKSKKYLLSYRNATPIEGILKRCRKASS